MTTTTGRALVVALSITTLATCAHAQSLEEFYRGKTLRMVIGHEVGGGYDTYARVVANHMTKHLPGAPAIIPQNMPGAGSRVATNWLYSVAPRDGTVMGMAGQAIAVDQATKQPGVQFKAEELGFIGNPSVDTMVMLTSAASGLKSLSDVKSKGGMVCGGSGGGAPTVTYPRLTKVLTGADIKVIAGYSGSGAYLLAMERGELNCVAGVSWTLARLQLANSLREGKLNLIMQIGPRSEPEIAAMIGREVPLVGELASNELDRKAVAVILSSVTIGRPIFAPPGVASDRLDALRSAFDKAMSDPDFLAEAAARKLTINPVTGLQLQNVVRDVTSAAPDVLARADTLISSGTEEKTQAK